MELSTAHEVKDQIRSGLVPLLWGPRQRGGGGEAMEGAIAVGIAPSPKESGQYLIAVRARSEGALPGVALDYLGKATRGDLDIRVTGPIRAPGPVAGPIAPAASLSIGSSIGHCSGCAGTLGFFAKSRRGEPGFVSNNHVIAAEDKGSDGDDILHPGGCSQGAVVGHLVGNYPRLRRPGPVTVDCAFAGLSDGVDIDVASIGDGDKLVPRPVLPAGQIEVSKIGRTTGLTCGRITAFGLDDLVVDYSFGPISFNGQIEIESLDERPFSMPGDSGSLIVTKDGHPLALLFARSAAGGRMNTGLTYASPIQAVLDALGVTLVT